MTTPKDLSAFTAADLNDATIDPAVLASLTQARPDLWPAILAHPNCYPELGAWIRKHTAPMPQEPQAPAPVTAAQWSATFQQANGREPSMSEYQAAVNAGLIAQERGPRDPSAEQMAAGAKQFATGAKEFFNNRVAPAAADATRAVHSAVQEQQREANATPTGWMSWAPFALPVAAFLALISLFLPAISAYGMSVSFFASGDGPILLVMMLLVIAASVTSIILRVKWARITAGAVGIAAGLMGLIDGFLTMGSATGIDGASVGVGLVLLVLFSVVVLAAAIIILLPAKKAATPAQTTVPPTI